MLLASITLLSSFGAEPNSAASATDGDSWSFLVMGDWGGQETVSHTSEFKYMYICSYPVSFYSATTMRFVQVACNSGCDVLRILPCPPDVFLSSCYHRCFFSCCFRSLPLPSLSGQPIRRFEFHVLSLLSCFDCVDAARVVRLPWEFNSIYHRTSSRTL